MTLLVFPRPMGATPYIVTVADLDDSLRFVLQQLQKYGMATASESRADKRLHLQSYRNAMTQYRQLKAEALPEILTAHAQHRSIIAA